MLSLQEIKNYYPENLQIFEGFIIREYLQYKILEIIFETPFQNKLSFLGGTCLRIIYHNKRFSEDLDFDNFNLSIDDFNSITRTIQKELERLGYLVEMRNVNKGAYHCYIRFPELLYNEKLSDHKEEKILIQLDTESHNFEYKPEKPLLNKFDVFTQINTSPPGLLLAQKFYAIVNRKRNKGRDFYDALFLLGLGYKPDFEYLKEKIDVSNSNELRSVVLEKCKTIDMKEMADDVVPFLFNPRDEKNILLFEDYIRQAKLGE